MSERTAVQEAERGLNALYVQVPESVARDVTERVHAAFEELRAEGAVYEETRLAAAARLHAPKRLGPEFRFQPWCEECSQGFTAGGDDPPTERRVWWPCPTAEALELVDPLAPTDESEKNPYLPKAPADGKHVFGEDGRSYRCSLCGVYNRTESPPFHEPCKGGWAESGKMRYAAKDRWDAERARR